MPQDTSPCPIYGAHQSLKAAYFSIDKASRSGRIFLTFLRVSVTMRTIRAFFGSTRYATISGLPERIHQIWMMAQIYRSHESTLVWLRKPLQGDYSFTWYPSGSLSSAFQKQISSNVYSTRLWIVQEVLLAPRVNVLYSRSWMTWKQLSEAVLPRLRAENYSPAVWLFYHRAGIVFETHEHLGPYQRSLKGIINIFCSINSQDLRDKFYGLLGDPQL